MYESDKCLGARPNYPGQHETFEGGGKHEDRLHLKERIRSEEVTEIVTTAAGGAALDGAATVETLHTKATACDCFSEFNGMLSPGTVS